MTTSSSRWFVLWQWPLVTVVACVAADQVTKLIILACETAPGQYVLADVIPGFFRIVRIRNTGAAFGFASGQSALLAVLSIIIFFIILWRFRDLAAGCRVKAFGVSLIMGGILGNLVDRIFYGGGVVDFIEVYYKGWSWPAFNIADAAITIGVAIFIILTLFAPAPTSSHDAAD